MWCLAVKVVSPCEVCNVSGLQGVWRLARRVPRQAVWKHVLPSGSEAAPGDIAKAEFVLACFGCVWSTRLW